MSPGRFARFAGLVVAILFSLGLGTFSPYLVPLFLAFWLAAFSMDVHSTWRVYRLEPEKFAENESNAFFVALYKKLGFKGSIPAFFVLVELPRFVLIALVCAPLVGASLSLSTSPFVGLGVAAAAQGYAHLDGWRVNSCFVAAKKGLTADFSHS